MSEAGQPPSQPHDDSPDPFNPRIAHEIGDEGPAAFRRWIAREIARAHVARSDAIGAFGRKALLAVMDQGLTVVRLATRALIRWATPTSPRLPRT